MEKQKVVARCPSHGRMNSLRYKKSGGHVLSHLIVGSGKTLKGNELETIYPPPYMQLHNGGEPYAYVCYIQTRDCLSVILPFIEIYQISRLRMKAETLSWPCGWLSPVGDSVHNAWQR